ncbi:MAG: flagellar basal body-associated protein FliL [Limnohabitans sp.]
MAEEVQEVESEPKKKKPILLILVGVLGLIVLLGGTVAATLFFSGFFNKPPVDPDQQIDAAVAGDGKDGKDKDGKPQKVKKDSPELTRYEHTYLQLEKDFIVNLTSSRKVMSVQIAISTRYDQRVIDNVKKHDMALRATILDTMRLTTDAEINKPEFRKELAAKVRDAMNSQLEKYEDFGGIEEVHFTSFLVQ